MNRSTGGDLVLEDLTVGEPRTSSTRGPVAPRTPRGWWKDARVSGSRPPCHSSVSALLAQSGCYFSRASLFAFLQGPRPEPQPHRGASLEILASDRRQGPRRSNSRAEGSRVIKSAPGGGHRAVAAWALTLDRAAWKPLVPWSPSTCEVLGANRDEL